MNNAQGFVGGGDHDQDRLLDEATCVVKEQAHYMKRAIDNDNLREALKHASNLICELRTSLLSPKKYTDLYFQVFQEMQHLQNFFNDKSRHNRKMLELYESVQHAGAILPRMYLLATVGASYIKSKEGSTKEILKDMNELMKGVQHPIRGLFLRYYLNYMVKDKMPDTGSDYESPEHGDINDAFEFVLTNFAESNRLWIRMQTQGAKKDEAKRQKERWDLRQLLGSHLNTMSSLEGMTLEYYSNIALPKLLDHITSMKDKMCQEYSFECIIHCFPDQHHIRTLEKLMEAFTKALPSVNMKDIFVKLLDKLTNYLKEKEEEGDSGHLLPTSGTDVFSLIRPHLKLILERSMEPGPATGAGPGAAIEPPDITNALEVQQTFMQFTSSLYPEKLHYVDIILGQTVDVLRRYQTVSNMTKVSGAAAKELCDLLAAPQKTHGLNVLQMESYTTLTTFLNFQTRKEVSIEMCKTLVDGNKKLTSVEAVKKLFEFIRPLIADVDDTPNDEGKDKEAFAADQAHVCKLIHQISGGRLGKVDSEAMDTDLDTEFTIINEMRTQVGCGGPQRLLHTLPAVFYIALGLIKKIKLRERAQVDTLPQISYKKIFGFLHKTVTAMVKLIESAHDSTEEQRKLIASMAISQWVTLASTVEQLDDDGQYQQIGVEFATQALIVMEEHITDGQAQFDAIRILVGGFSKIRYLEADEYDEFAAKITKHAARILKKQIQVQAVVLCAQLFWSAAKKDGKRVSECLQRAAKTIQSLCEQDEKNMTLWCFTLDSYVYFYELGVEDITMTFINTLIDLTVTHVKSAAAEAKAEKDQTAAQLKTSLQYLREKKATDPRFQELTEPDPF